MKKLALFILLLLPFTAGAQVIITVAGGNGAGFTGDGGPATNAKLNYAYDIGLDDSGMLYIADEGNYRIRKVDRTGIIRTICGNGSAGYSGDGFQAIYAAISGIHDFAFDHHGNIYISEAGNSCVRKIDADGIITTLVGTGVAGFSGDAGPANVAQLNQPTGIVLDDTGNMYINDFANQRIRKINTAGVISTIAGTGVIGFSPDGSRADTAKLLVGGNIRLDGHNNLLFTDNGRVRCISTSGVLFTIAGTGVAGYSGDGGPAITAQIDPANIAIDKYGNIYIADQSNYRVRMVTSEGTITTIAGIGLPGNSGDGGNPLLAKLIAPYSVDVDTAGNIYICDVRSQNVRKITLDTPVSVNPVNENTERLFVFPNPSKGNFDILIKHTYSTDFDVFITDSKGIIQNKLVIRANDCKQINTDLPPGHYLISVMVGEQYYSQKLIIQ